MTKLITPDDGHAQVDLQVLDTSVDERDCSNTVLDTLDQCVGCVEGVEIQTAFEDRLGSQPLFELDDSYYYFEGGDTGGAEPPHGLSPSEAALMRLQLMEVADRLEQPQSPPCRSSGAARATDLSSLTDFDLLNLCGSDDDFLPQSRGTTPAAAAAAAAASACVACPKLESVNTTMETHQTDEVTTTPLEQSFVSTVGDAADLMRTAIDQEGEALLQCRICLDEGLAHSKRISFATLPCCGGESAPSSSALSSAITTATTTMLCSTCLFVLTAPTRDGTSRVGRCPCCRTWIVVETMAPETSTTTSFSVAAESLDVRLVSVAGKCQVCCQIKELLVEDSSVCDACFVGRRQPLVYKCEHCQSSQRIPHPLYRYQSSPDDPSEMKWNCNACRKFCRWNLVLDQISLIPVGDAPESWNESTLKAARHRVQAARSAAAAAAEAEASSQHGRVSSSLATHHDGSSCRIL